MKLILGSSSKYRRKVLEDFGYKFEIMSPDIDEKSIRHTDYYRLPSLIANAKMDAILLKALDESVMITADQVVVCNGYLFEKPKDKDEARFFLEKYSEGHVAETVSALVVSNIKTGKRVFGTDIAKVFYNKIPANVIDDFIENGDPYSKAGGFSIESEILIPYQNKIEGTEDSIRGMPIELLNKLLKEVN